MHSRNLFGPRSGTVRVIHPNAWLWEPLERDPTFMLRAMFGGRAVYLDGRLMLFFTPLHWDDEDWRGICVPTEREHHAALMREFPELAPHPVLSKWLYLHESAERFESVAKCLVELSHRRDPRIGVTPKPRKPKPRKLRRTKTPVAKTPAKPVVAARGARKTVRKS